MIVGMGAVGHGGRETPKPRASAASRPIVRGAQHAVTANSAFHGTRLDVEHIRQVPWKRLVSQCRDRVGASTATPSRRSCVFVSHETYTPARGGSASGRGRTPCATSSALTPPIRIVVTNTKGLHRPRDGRRHRRRAWRSRRSRPAWCRRCPTTEKSDPDLGPPQPVARAASYPVRYALAAWERDSAPRSASPCCAGFPRPTGDRRAPDAPGPSTYADRRSWRRGTRWLAQSISGYSAASSSRSMNRTAAGVRPHGSTRAGRAGGVGADVCLSRRRARNPSSHAMAPADA